MTGNTEPMMVETTPHKGIRKSGSLGENDESGDEISDETFATITRWIFDKHSDTLQKEVSDYFTKKLAIDKWSLLYGSNPDHLEKALDNIASTSTLNGFIYRGRLLQVLLFGTIPGSFLSPGMTYQDAVDKLNQINSANSSLSGMSSSSSSQRKTPSMDDKLKFTVPTLPTFSGVPSTFYGWKQKVRYVLTQATILDSITDDTFHAKNQLTSTAVFGAIATACSQGDARTFAANLEADGNRSSRELFKLLETTYHTPMNQANFVITAIRKLISLKLDNHMTVSSFISEFDTILRELEDNGTPAQSIPCILNSQHSIARIQE